MATEVVHVTPKHVSDRLRQRNDVPKTTVLYSVLLAIVGVGCISYGSVLAAESEASPLATSFFRFALAAPFCLILGIVSDRGFGGFVRLVGRWQVWLAAIAFASTIGLWFEGQRMSSVASAGAVHNLAPVVVVGLGWVLYRKLPGYVGVFGLLIAILGGFVLVYEDAVILGHDALIGDELALASAVTLAIYYLCIEKVSSEASAFTLIGLVTVIAAPCVLAATLVSGEQLLPESSTGWAILFGVAFLGQIGGQAALARAATSIGAFGISTISLAEPALAALLALVVLSQPVTAFEWLGILVLALGVAFAQAGFRRTSQDPKESD